MITLKAISGPMTDGDAALAAAFFRFRYSSSFPAAFREDASAVLARVAAGDAILAVAADGAGVVRGGAVVGLHGAFAEVEYVCSRRGATPRGIGRRALDAALDAAPAPAVVWAALPAPGLRRGDDVMDAARRYDIFRAWGFDDTGLPWRSIAAAAPAVRMALLYRAAARPAPEDVRAYAAMRLRRAGQDVRGADLLAYGIEERNRR